VFHLGGLPACERPELPTSGIGMSRIEQGTQGGRKAERSSSVTWCHRSRRTFQRILDAAFPRNRVVAELFPICRHMATGLKRYGTT
jgi:hypothetical protein